MSSSAFIAPLDEDNLIRRVLYPSLPRNVRPVPPLPPLLVELPPTPLWDEAQHSLRHLLALLFREAVLSWYVKLTPDRALLGEATGIVAHVLQRVQLTLASEEGTRRGAVFLGRQLPELLKSHYEEARAAQRRKERMPAGWQLRRSLEGGKHSLDHLQESVSLSAQLYATANPHPALVVGLTPAGHISLGYLRLLCDTALRDLLPPVDAACELERLLVRDIIAAILRGSLAKCSRPWFFTQSIHKVLDGLEAPEASASMKTPASQPAQSFAPWLQRAWSTLQMLIALLIPYVLRPFLEAFMPSSFTSPGTISNETSGFEPSTSEPTVGGAAATLESGARRSHLRPRRQGFSSKGSTPGGRRWTVHSGDGSSFEVAPGISEALVEEEDEQDEEGDANLGTSPETSTRVPFLEPYTDLLIEVLLLRNSALGTQLAALLSLGVQLGGTRAEALILTQLSRLLTPQLLTTLLNTARQAMLPDGHFQPAPPDPTPAQQLEEWERLPARVLARIPPPARIVLGLGIRADAQLQTMRDVLAPLCAPDAAGPNTHLVLGLLERAFVVLLPQLEVDDAQ